MAKDCAELIGPTRRQARWRLRCGGAAVALALAWVSPPALAGPPQPAAQRRTVGVDISALPLPLVERIDALTLETRVVLRLLQEGFAVAAPFTSPDVTLHLRPSEDPNALVLEGRGGQLQEQVTVWLVGTRAELQLELSQKLVGLARQVVAQLPPLDEGRRPGPLLALPEAPAGGQARTRRPWVALALGADALVRVGGTDPFARVFLAAGDRAFLRLSAGASRAEREGLSITEWQLLLGPGLRLWDWDRWSARSAILVGVFSHRFTFEDPPQPTREDGYLEILGSLEVDVRFRLGGPFQAGVRLSPGVTGHGFEHVRGEQVVSRRLAGRLEAGAFLGVEL
jgi:hypothetical protein